MATEPVLQPSPQGPELPGPTDETVRRLVGDSGASTIGRYRYPMNVATDALGHYISFYAVEVEGIKLDTQSATEAIGSLGSIDLRTAANGIRDVRNTTIDAVAAIGRDFLFLRDNPAASTKFRTREATGLQGQRSTVKDIITLYMPEQIGSTYSLRYGEQNFSTISGIRSLVSAAANGGDSRAALAAADFIREAASGPSFGAIDAAARLASGTVNSQEYLRALQRRTPNPHLEFTFEGVDRRKFSYTFNFAPRSHEETDMVQSIISRFKYHSLPKVSESGRRYIYPNEFEIEYHYRGAQNLFLNKISRCALEEIDVAYTPDGRFSAFHDGSPTRCQVTLRFTELEIMHRDRVEEGF